MSDAMLKDDLEKVLAELETQGVDITAIKDALASGGSVVKSVQQGVISMKTDKKPITATINEVNVEKSVVLFNGAGCSSTSNEKLPWVKLTDSTTVSADSITAGNSNYPAAVAFTVLEFY